jgi:N-acylneuraminate cytidylyltransferase/CMP-N,N'-diacetyllegionaminic acid synthase
MMSLNVLGIIPARGGSEGIFRKNIKTLSGKPLIAWTIEASLNSKFINKLIVSTEDQEIADISLKYGAKVPFIRPSDIAKHSSSRNEVVLHAIKSLPGFDYVVLLQPTSPFRQTKHIDEAFEFLLNKNAPACVSVVEQDQPPFWMYKMTNEKKLTPLIEENKFNRRQLVPKSYSLNGAIFICNTKYFLSSDHPDPFITSNTIGYEMSAEFSLDIDDEWDWKIAEAIFSKNG